MRWALVALARKVVANAEPGKCRTRVAIWAEMDMKLRQFVMGDAVSAAYLVITRARPRHFQ